MQLPKHGANPHRLYEQLTIPMPAVVYDFSENVNAFGLPESIRREWPQLLEKVSAYPDPKGEPFLSAIAKFHHVSKDCLFVGNGAAEIFSLLAERYRGKKAILVHPTFSEYEATLQAKGAEIEHIVASECTGFDLPIEAIQQAMETADVLYLCTPNNPTGLLPEASDLTQLVEHGKKVKCEIVLDEAFIDFVGESFSFISKVKEMEHLIIVRSMTKMYAIAGIRLGYVISHSSIIREISAQAPHWNVNGIAATIGAICVDEHEFVEETKKQSGREREKMTSYLVENGCIVLNSVVNYVVFKLQDATKTKQLYRHLLARGIVLRHTHNYRGMNGQWLRIGMKKEAEMSLLRRELSRWFVENSYL